MRLDIKDIILITILLIGVFGIIYSAYLIGVYTASRSIFTGMSTMMGHMMGRETNVYHIPVYIWFVGYTSIILFVLGLVGLIYDFIFLRKGGDSGLKMRSIEENRGIDDILKILKPDERRVVETLLEHGGSMLQRDIRWETGFSRLKVHRVIERLIERRIVKKIPKGSTNQIVLEDWILKRYKGEEG